MLSSSILSSTISTAGWRPVPHPVAAPHPGLVILLAMLASAAGIVLDWTLAGRGGVFQLYGVNSALLSSVITVALVSLAAPAGSRTTAIAIVLSLSALANLVAAGAMLTLETLAPEDAGEVSNLRFLSTMAAVLGLIVWFIGSVGTTLRSVASKRPLMRASGVTFASMLLALMLPYWPSFASPDFSRTTANVWELASAYRASRAEPASDQTDDQDGWAAIELAQPALLERRLAALAPRQPGASNLYLLGIAGWSEQNVFASEIKGALAVLGERLDASGRAIQLVNNRASVSDEPLATLPNLAAALRGIALRMDLANDALVVVLSSHGSRSGIGLEFDSLVSRILSPATLKAALDEAGIRNRIIVVSACYSGVFVPALADDHTVVVTASSASTSSFGCSGEREWTYFGDAFFNRSIKSNVSLAAAFANARDLVGEWEARDDLQPSRPQIHIGSAVKARLPFIGNAAVEPADN